MLVCTGPERRGVRGGEEELWLILENPVSVLSGDVTGCEWVDSACIRFSK